MDIMQRIKIDLEQMDKNATLIAAAPELLEALKGLLAGPNWPVARMTAEHAIAKAEGKLPLL